MDSNDYYYLWEEQRKIDAMAVSLEEQLSTVYPQGPDWRKPENDSSQIEQEAFLRSSLEKMVRELPYPMEDHERLKRALETAVRNWMDGHGEKPSKPQSTTSFGSLLDQFSGGFLPPVSLEEIQQAETSKDRLTVFRKVEYLEDLLLDWKEISGILQRDVVEACSEIDSEGALEWIALHRKWFHQGRSSSEYTPLLYGICEILGATIAKVSTTLQDANTKSTRPTNEGPTPCLLIALVHNWRDMWLDLMQRDQYSEDLAETIETVVVPLLIAPSASNETKDSRTLLWKVQAILAKIDPKARWFHSWTNLVHDDNKVRSLFTSITAVGRTNVLSAIWEQRSKDRNEATWFHSTSILAILICRTRLSGFPWEALEKSDDPKDRPRCLQQHSDELLQWFLRALQVAVDPHMRSLFLSGIESILAGSHDNPSDLERKREMVRSGVPQTSTPFSTSDPSKAAL